MSCWAGFPSILPSQNSLKGSSVSKTTFPNEFKITNRSFEKQSLPPKKNYKSTKPGSSKVDQDKFLDLLSRHIAKFQRYPRLAQRRGWEGKTVLNIKLTDTGDLISKNISISSGFKILDNEAMKMIDRAMPLPVSSELLNNKIFTIYIPIKFEIN